MEAFSKTILIVEDDRVLTAAYQTKLESEGFKVATALDGKEALDYIETSKPDLIILDIVLPVMNGVEFLKQMKVRFPDDDIPVIALTNLDDLVNAERVKHYGAREYLIKSDVAIQDVPDHIRKYIS